MRAIHGAAHDDEAPVGHSYETTVRVYCIIRLMLQFEMGYYYYPTDLPISGMPHLEVPPPVMSDEYIVHRLLSCMFDTMERSAALMGELGWNCDMSNTMVKGNMDFFKREMSRFKLDPVPTSALPEVHAWFWMYMGTYVVNRVHYLGFTSSLKHPEDLFVPKHGTALITRLTSECRAELLINLARRWNSHQWTPPPLFVPSCQFLLDRATTRYQHVALRFVAMCAGSNLLLCGKFDTSMFADEVTACTTICEQSQFSATLASTRLVLDADLTTLSKNRECYLAAGQTLGALAEDKRLVSHLLAQDDSLLRAGDGGTTILATIKSSFDLELSLWGPLPPRNSHESHLITHLCNLAADPSPLSLPALSVLVSASLATHTLAIALNRAPKWETGQTLLLNTFGTTAKYFSRIYAKIPPSRFVCELMRDIAWVGVEDVHRVPGWDSESKTLRRDHSTWMSHYAAWAPMCARWGDPAGLVGRLDRLQGFLDKEVEIDLRRKDYGNAIRKCAAVAEIGLYHPAKGGVRTISGSGGAYGLAVRLLGDEEYWVGKPKGEMEEAAWLVRRVEGGYRAPGGERRVPGQPDGRDFWTYEWGLLATMPHLRYHNDARMAKWEQKIKCELDMLSTRVLYDEYFGKCVGEAKEVLRLPG